MCIRDSYYGGRHYFNNGQFVWLGSPRYFDFSDAGVGTVYANGWNLGDVRLSNGVRPSVSLKPGTEFKSGDGSFTAPFVIE